ncbi:hypothetical protein CPC08DRAFT_754510 [Agrocybe pediades]|nr:hypothetical protein CPC08DRAFT_754510 [Agrocybe pediades]
MSDEDIVYLGQSSPSSRLAAAAQRPVTGIVLHVEKNGDVEAHSLTFKRANNGTVVHVGRRSAFEPLSSDVGDGPDPACAMFRCAVVSRKHAKIAFADSGHAYLIDLGSHHGTHIRKPGEKFSKMIQPETPTVLADGDVVTFGKSVGKGDELVRPVVVRVELIEGPVVIPRINPFKPLVVPSPSTSERKAKSGRYGVGSSPSSSSSSSSSSDEFQSSKSGIYSDIEEVSPPPEPSPMPALAPSELESAAVNDESHDGHELQRTPAAPCNPVSLNSLAFNVLRRLLPPNIPPSSPRRLPSLTEIVERPFAHMSSFILGPDSVHSPSQGPSSARNSPLLSMFNNNACHMHHLPPPPPMCFHASGHDIYDPHSHHVPAAYQASRSHSPMDLASPSPAPEVIVSRPLSIPPPPNDIMRPDDAKDAALPAGPDIVNSPVVDSPNPDFGTVVPLLSNHSSMAEDLMADAHASFEQDILPGSPSALPVTGQQWRQTQNSLAAIKTELAKLQTHRRKYKARFNSNVHVMTEKLGEFDDRLLEVNAEYLLLSNQVERIQNDDMPELNLFIESVQERVMELVDEVEKNKEKEDAEMKGVKEEMEGVKEKVKSFGEVVRELEEFREQTRQRMEYELDAMREMRDSVMASLAEQMEEVRALKEKLAQQPSLIPHAGSVLLADAVDIDKTPVRTSLKRKRDDTDENEDVDVDVGSDAVDEDADVVMLESSKSKSNDNSSTTAGPESALCTPPPSPSPPAPPRKRARTVASVVAQTATAVTIGAVVTWSALAFS